MTQPPLNAWEWVGRVVGIGTICAGVYAIGAKIFSYVTRTELAEIIAAQNVQFLAAQASMKADVDAKFEQHRSERVRIANEQHAETIRLHEENRETSDQIFSRTAKIEQAQARIEGVLSIALQNPQQTPDK
jgi:hypothetical protein